VRKAREQVEKDEEPGLSRVVFVELDGSILKDERASCARLRQELNLVLHRDKDLVPDSNVPVLKPLVRMYVCMYVRSL